MNYRMWSKNHILLVRITSTSIQISEIWFSILTIKFLSMMTNFLMTFRWRRNHQLFLDFRISKSLQFRSRLMRIKQKVGNSLLFFSILIFKLKPVDRTSQLSNLNSSNLSKKVRNLTMLLILLNPMTMCGTMIMLLMQLL